MKKAMRKDDSQRSEFDEPAASSVRESLRRKSQFPQNLDDFDEFIVGRQQSVDEGEGGGALLKTDSILSTRSAQSAKSAAGHGGAEHHRTSHPEWTDLRLFNTIGGGFDLEMWWRHAAEKSRLAVLLVVIILAIALLNLGVGIWFIVLSLSDPIPDPYVCRTPECKTAGSRLQEFMNKSEEPCDNFYEFMCRNYVEPERQGDLYSELITVPSLKVELGDDSMLAKLLKRSGKTAKHNQHIDFYQTCLKFAGRTDEYRSEAFQETAEQWFGTRDFTTFERMTEPSMAQIGANIFKDFGHASFINMGFFTYPSIVILEPFDRVAFYRLDDDPGKEKYIGKVFTGLMGYLGLEPASPSSQAIVEDMVLGTHVMSTVINELYYGAMGIPYEDFPADSSLTKLPPQIAELIGAGGKLDGMCPPMGIQLDYLEVLKLFLEEPDHKVEYYTPTAAKYALGFSACFGKHKSGFTKYQITHRRTAFVALWILDVFLHDLMLGMNYKDVSSWGLHLDGDYDYDVTEFASNGHIHQLTEDNEQYDCLLALWRVMGNIPTLRFMEFDLVDRKPAEWIQAAIEASHLLYDAAKQAYYHIPPSEVDWKEAYFAKTLSSRRFEMDVEVHLLGGVVDITIEDLLFTDDFLRNIIEGTRYTVRKARLGWEGSTDPTPTVKWWAHGGPEDFKDMLFLPHLLQIDSARFVEEKSAVNKQKWEKLHGRSMVNYIRFPMAIFHGRKIDFLAVKYPQIVIPRMRAIVTVMNDAALRGRYPSLTWDELITEPANIQSYQNERPCSMLEVVWETNSTSRPLYPMIPSTPKDFSWGHENLFLSLFTLKLTYKGFTDELKSFRGRTFNHDLDEKRRKLITRKGLPGWLEKFTEDQLFFMQHARDVCRTSWKTETSEEGQRDRYHLETTFLSILMQMEEFSRVWKCPKNSMMNNWGEPRCIQWSP